LLNPDSYNSSSSATKPTIDDIPQLQTGKTDTFPLLLRATDGDKFKISTIVSQDGLEEFFSKYGEVCKGGMQGLKKRDRKKEKAKREKKKEKK
jgi:signal recognition particle subunit SRP14